MDGVESKSRLANLEVLDASKVVLSITNPDTGKISQQFFVFDDLTIESRLGNTPRQIALPNNQVFSSSDHQQVDTLQKKYMPSLFTGLIHFLESHLLLACIALVLTIGFTIGLTTYGIPKASELIAKSIPYNELGDHSLAILDETVFEPSNLSKEEQSRVLALVSPYINQYPSVKPELLFRSGMGANALALPDGNIVFTDDFVVLAEQDEELLSVLFHEIGHIKNKHIIRRAIQGTALTVFIFLITGDIELFDFTAAIPAALMDLSYSREFEREADRFAIKEMSKFNIDHSHFINIMTKLEGSNRPSGSPEEGKKFSIPEFFSTHPLTEERIRLYKES